MLISAPEGMLISVFHNGLRLKEEIRAELRMVTGQGLLQLTKQALMIEACNNALDKIREGIHQSLKRSTRPKWFASRPSLSKP